MNENKKIKRIKRLFAVIFILFFCLAAFILRFTWIMSLKITTDYALELASMAAAGFQKNMMLELDIKEDDIEKPEYQEIKKSLIEIKELNQQIKFAYLLIKKEGQVYFIADSEPSTSKDYSPPGQEYFEISEIEYGIFESGKTIITGPSEDRWGTWMSVMVPLFDDEENVNKIVFGVDYPAADWNNKAIKDLIITGLILGGIFVILLFLYLVVIKNEQLKLEKIHLEKLSNKQKESKILFRNIFKQSPIGVAIVDNQMHISMINPAFLTIIGRSKEELTHLKWQEISNKDDLKEDLESFEKFIAGEIQGYAMIKRYYKPDGSEVTVKMIITPFQSDRESRFHHLCLIDDISERIQIDKLLKESERSRAVLINNIPGMVYRCKFDHKWTMEFISEGCFKLTGYKPEELTKNKKISFNDIICLKYRENLWNKWIEVIEMKKNFKEEYEIMTASGEKKWVLEQGQGVFDKKGEILALEGLIIDITELKMKENEIKYINDHDDLTGIYNRRYFNKKIMEIDVDDQLPIAYITSDINGVKLINDALGDVKGDFLIKKTAEIIERCSRDKDILARTGGDEFSMILPQTDERTANEMVTKIKEGCKEYNNNNINQEIIQINLSLGLGIKKTNDQLMKDVIKEAEDDMYKEKLLESRSTHSSIISSIRATMLEKSQETEAHAERLVKFSKAIGKELNLPQRELARLELFAMLHDIGKIGIADCILNKPGKLLDDEWAIMKKHPEIGYRIAMSAPELSEIADYILSHHERWDGKGYPQGLKGNEVLLGARILAVADAYDAMTSDRSYRKAMDKETAIKELIKNAGSQFDPNIVEVFVTKVLKKRMIYNVHACQDTKSEYLR